MNTLEVIALALIQGFTEFLPISSSAHLVLPSQVWGWSDQGLAFDVAVHVGSLLAVVGYFRNEVAELLFAWVGSLSGKGHNAHSRLAWLIILATIPAGLAGVLLGGVIETLVRGNAAMVIATTTVVFGLLLWWADKKASEVQVMQKMSVRHALAIGCAQAVALLPGTSRSGITMTTALMLGFNRQDAARFSFLLSIPVIAMAGSYQMLKLASDTAPVDWSGIMLGTVLAFISAYVCIHFFLKVISRMGMTPFVIYRLLLGLGLWWFLLL